MVKNAAVSALLKPTAQHGRNNFPLDNKHVYSIKAGQITPIKALHYEPGSFFNIKASDFTMTFPMTTAPFLRGRKETAFYSVYYNAVWSLFNQYQATKNDPKTSAFGYKPTLVEPRMPLLDMYAAIFNQFLGYMFYEHYIEFYVRHNYTEADEETKLSYIASAQHAYFDGTFMGSNQFQFGTNFTDINGNNVNISYAYDKLYGSYYDIDFFDLRENSMSIEAFYKDIVGHHRVYNWVRKLDMLGYGNIYPTLRSVEDSLVEIMEASSPWATLETLYANTMTSLATALFKQVATYSGNPASPSNVVLKYVNLYPICAYNSVFYHFFRNSFYDLNYHPNDYNLDFISVTGSSTGIVHLREFTTRFLDIEYHQWKKDTFTGVLPDTQFGAVSSIDINMDAYLSVSGTTGTDGGRWVDLNGNTPGASSDVTTNASGSSLFAGGTIQHTHVVSGIATVPTPNFDVIALKRAEMLQDYRQQLMRAGNRTSDVFKAIYGGSPSSEHEDDVIPRFLDTFGEDIFIDPVISQANTDTAVNGNLGDIAARGKFSGSSPDIKFNSGNNFGLIIALTYFVPTAEYNSYMFDKHIFELTPEDHFIPQFENLGLEPILSDELNSLLPANDVRILGYGPRYHHKKSEVDMVHGAFVSLPRRQTEGSYTDGVYTMGIDSQFLGDFNNWVSPRTDLQNRTSTAKRDFYINPSVLDNVFVAKAGADIAQDQFICNTYFEINATKQMSKVGLINFV